MALKATSTFSRSSSGDRVVRDLLLPLLAVHARRIQAARSGDGGAHVFERAVEELPLQAEYDRE